MSVFCHSSSILCLWLYGTFTLSQNFMTFVNLTSIPFLFYLSVELTFAIKQNFLWLECKSKFRIFGKIGELAKKGYFCGRYFCKVPLRTFSNPKIGVKHPEVNLFCKTNVNPCFCLYSLFCPVLPVFFIF